jgi:hypothetical protein
MIVETNKTFCDGNCRDKAEIVLPAASKMSAASSHPDFNGVKNETISNAKTIAREAVKSQWNQ